MACRYYDDVMVAKLKKWVPDKSKLRILSPDETRRLIETIADDQNDKKIKLPMIALSRNTDIELDLSIKNPKSFDGPLARATDTTASGGSYLLNSIPIKLTYQLDIYTKTYEEGDEYVRNFLFKLINNPAIRIGIPYNGIEKEFRANIRVLNTVSNTSGISERIYAGQFTRWTIQLEIQDAQLFSIPYRNNWTLYVDSGDNEGISGEHALDYQSWLEISEDIRLEGEREQLFGRNTDNY